MRRPAAESTAAAGANSAVVPLNNVTLMMARRGGRLDAAEGWEEEEEEVLAAGLEDVELTTTSTPARGGGEGEGPAGEVALGPSSSAPSVVEDEADPLSSSTISTLFGQVLRRPLWTMPPASERRPPTPPDAGDQGEGEEVVVITLGNGETHDQDTTPPPPLQQFFHQLFRRSSSSPAPTTTPAAAPTTPLSLASNHSRAEPPTDLSSSSSSSASFWSACSTSLRRNHLMVLYLLGGLLLTRMLFFSVERKDSKLAVFVGFVIALGGYIWWMRRVRLARIEALNQAAAEAAVHGRVGRGGGLLEHVDLEELERIMLEARRQEQARGLSAEGKAALVRFPYTAGRAEEEERKKGLKEKGSVISLAGTVGPVEEEEEEEEEPQRRVLLGQVRPSSFGSLEGTKQPSGLEEEEEEEGWRRGESEEEGRGGEFSSSSSLSALPGRKEVDVTDEEEGKGGGEVAKTAHVDKHCSICLGDYEEGETLCMLPCLHTYHDACVDVWISGRATCPLCNYDLMSATGSPHYGTDTPMAPRGYGSDDDDEEEEEEEEEEEVVRIVTVQV